MFCILDSHALYSKEHLDTDFGLSILFSSCDLPHRCSSFQAFYEGNPFVPAMNVSGPEDGYTTYTSPVRHTDLNNDRPRLIPCISLADLVSLNTVLLTLPLGRAFVD